MCISYLTLDPRSHVHSKHQEIEHEGHSKFDPSCKPRISKVWQQSCMFRAVLPPAERDSESAMARILASRSVFARTGNQ